MDGIQRERPETMVKRGAFFTKVEGELRFMYVSDANSIVGPRAATEQDQKNHPEAWAAFLIEDGLSPLPPDGDGPPFRT